MVLLPEDGRPVNQIVAPFCLSSFGAVRAVDVSFVPGDVRCDLFGHVDCSLLLRQSR